MVWGNCDFQWNSFMFLDLVIRAGGGDKGGDG